MRVNILSYEPTGGWILYDYAEKLVTHLRPHVDEVDLTSRQADGYDVTFHINYYGLDKPRAAGLHCTMVTHIDTPEKFELVKVHAKRGVWGFCMSEETRRRLNTLTGIPRFLGFAPPAMRAAAKKTMSVMMAGRLYEDGRKNEQWALDFFRRLHPESLTIRVMGAGWGEQLARLGQEGYTVDYHESFDRDSYANMLRASDYLLVTGNDEGALSALDAIVYGVVPIVTAQGYHLEQPGEMRLFSTHEQLLAIADELQAGIDRTNCLRREMTDWDSFARRHVDAWQQIIAGRLGEPKRRQ